MPDWYRNTDWNDEIEAEFFAPLNRARAQRDQYIVLQALHLAESHPEVALRLVDFYFETRTDDFDTARARRAASIAHFALGGFRKALDDYLAVLEAGGEGKVMHVGSPLDFAFLAARYRSEAHYLPALDQLDAVSAPPATNPGLRFRYLSARALLLAETGRDPAGALNGAHEALGLPPVVVETCPDIVWRLRGITRR